MKQYTISETVFESLFAPNEWFQVPLAVFKFLTIEEVIVLSYLIGMSRKYRAIKKQKGWFKQKSAHLTKLFCISQHTQARIMKRLESKGFISTKRQGLPCRRYVRIEFEKLVKSVRELVSEDPQILLPEDPKGHKVNTIANAIVRASPARSPAPRKKTTYFLNEACKLLKTSVHRQSNNIASWHINYQWREFQKLIKQLEGNEDLFLDVLEWYCSHIKDIRTLRLPMCVSPKEFRLRWSWIHERYKDQAPREVKVEISEQAYHIADNLDGLNWPKGSAASLPNVVQQSLNEYHKRMSQISKWLRRNSTFDKSTGTYRPKRKQTEKLVPTIVFLNRSLCSPSHFVEQWFRDLRKKVEGWKTWKGDLFNHRVTKEVVENKIKEILMQYGKSAKQIEHFMEMLNEG